MFDHPAALYNIQVQWAHWWAKNDQKLAQVKVNSSSVSHYVPNNVHYVAYICINTNRFHQGISVRVWQPINVFFEESSVPAWYDGKNCQDAIGDWSRINATIDPLMPTHVSFTSLLSFLFSHKYFQALLTIFLSIIRFFHFSRVCGTVESKNLILWKSQKLNDKTTKRQTGPKGESKCLQLYMCLVKIHLKGSKTSSQTMHSALPRRDVCQIGNCHRLQMFRKTRRQRGAERSRTEEKE